MTRNIIYRSLGFLVLAVLASVMTACDAIYEESDCTESATLFTFTYDMNLKHADAFDHSVKSVRLLMFDASGVLRYQWRKDKSELLEGNKLLVNVAPGEYDVLTWAGDYHKSALIADGEVGKSRIEDFHCFVSRNEGGHIKDDIEDFFHSLKRVVLPYASPSKPHREILNLTKDTNSVRIVLQQLSGDPVELSGLTITITDENGWLAHDNSLLPDIPLTYYPWFTKSGSVDISGAQPFDYSCSIGLPEVSALGALTAELTVSRLMMTKKPVVNVARPDGSLVLSVPLIDYALLVKGKYGEEMSDQEYIDRQDEYNMTFFLDRNLEWISSQIIINNWIIVENDVEIGD